MFGQSIILTPFTAGVYCLCILVSFWWKVFELLFFGKNGIPVWRVAGKLGHQFAVQGQRYQFSFGSTNSRQRIGMKSPSITDETSAEDLFTQMSVYELRGLERKTRQVPLDVVLNPGIESSLAYLNC